MQGIILAAGMGKRLKELTKNNTKCMVEVNGVSLIERLLRQLEQCSLSRIVIVVGYQAEKLIEFIATLDIKTPIIYINNSVYNSTNNIYSLHLAKEWLCREDTLLFESDIIFEDEVLFGLINDERETLALVDKYESWMDGTCMRLSDDDTIEEFISGNGFRFGETGNYYKTVNVYKFSKHFSETHYVPFLEAYITASGNNEYYEQVLKVITMLAHPEIKARRLNGEKWYEIDDIQDLDIASTMFAESDQCVHLLQKRYGGYWRYPQMIDFCYLVNPFFPPQRLIDEMKLSFEKLLMQYPSGMEINALLAAKNFNLHPEDIVVGNGAAELIKAFMGLLHGKTGIVKPTFEEYANRYTEQLEVFVPENRDFHYTADDVINYFDDKAIENLLIINPDNPSGNYIAKENILKLISWAGNKNINIVIDESFIDFADEMDATIIRQDILYENPHLTVIKSISKSYGIPGLRLGVLASGNKELIAKLKKEVAIWNINSFAEFYMQIAEKYKGDYADGLRLLREERKSLVKELETIDAIRVIPSQANYIMLELVNGKTASELVSDLLVKYNILAKDLSPKIESGEYVRIAIRNHEDNETLVFALKEILNGRFVDESLG
ncbi:MAG: aminotransferase class I/II-fold pyridoxal phosphate-dependent enzyme [Clostridium sp.]|nr:aminotransferase class I/II-fold pyridoxal phosphate-dependent enzyme [Clostridium sp.]MCM1173192.1 aminotransferase class I/II-fold pyridoxal phosphate-dependent enzyme [Clostridium sp.]MCM1209149.1 aminotransferase class I/II-fold pyridoxal phosphate-dependent enzyme [Ruminococcus sp.]